MPAAPLSILNTDMWSWKLPKVREYLASLHAQAVELGKSKDGSVKSIADAVLEVYAKLIDPCFKGGATLGPYQTKQVPKSKDNPNGFTVGSVKILDSVGPITELVDFYSAFGWIIGMLETEIHAHANANEHEFCKGLVLRFAKLCWVMHNEYFAPEGQKILDKKKPQAQTAPAQAYILYGDIGTETERIPTIPGDNAATLSTSLPETVPILTGGAFMKKRAQAITAQLVYEALPGVKESAQAAGAVKGNPKSGNCAEWRAWAARLRPDVVLFGLCVNIKLVGGCTSLEQAMSPEKEHCQTPACNTCATILRFKDGEGKAFNYTDKAPPLKK